MPSSTKADLPSAMIASTGQLAAAYRAALVDANVVLIGRPGDTPGADSAVRGYRVDWMPLRKPCENQKLIPVHL
jgi:hypothetical protein